MKKHRHLSSTPAYRYLSYMLWDEVGCRWTEKVVRGVDINSSAQEIADATDVEHNCWNRVEDSLDGKTVRIIDVRNDRHQALILMRKEDQNQESLEYRYKCSQSWEEVRPYNIVVGDVIAETEFAGGDGMVVERIERMGTNPNLQRLGWFSFYEFHGHISIGKVVKVVGLKRDEPVYRKKSK